MSDTAPRGIKHSPAAGQVTFYGKTDKVKIHRDGNGTPVPFRLDATGSSDLFDLAGDRMLPSMLDDMRAFEPGSIIFSNHAYILPKNAIGRLVDHPHLAVVTAQKDTPFVRAGQEYMEMNFSFDVLTNNPEAVQIHDYVKEFNLKVGTSVGVEVTDWEVRYEDDYPVGCDFAHGILLEISTVGIPCNFQSWVKAAMNGLQKQYGTPMPVDKPSDLIYMARHWGDFEGDIDRLTLARLNKKFQVKRLDFAEFDPEDRTTLANLDTVLRDSGLYIERLPLAA